MENSPIKTDVLKLGGTNFKLQPLKETLSQREERFGKEVAELLSLKFDKKGHTNTSFGTKTLLGLGRTILSLLDKVQEGLPDTKYWTWDDFEKYDSSGKMLKEMRANDPDRYQKLFDKKYF